MVFFTCNHCGACMKKNKVEKHPWQGCRKMISVSCHDCLKDFRGQEYEKHTKCITEDEKYSGKDFTPKPQSCKGSLKQEAWIQFVREIRQTELNLTKSESNLLDAVAKYENIPRKKPQFVNFIHNIFHHKMPIAAIDRVWDLLMQKKSASGKETASKTEMEKPLPQSNRNQNEVGRSESKLMEEDSNSTFKRVSGITPQEDDNILQDDVPVVPRKKKRKKRSDSNEPVKHVEEVSDSKDVQKQKVIKKLPSDSDPMSNTATFESSSVEGKDIGKNRELRVCIKCGISEVVKQGHKRKKH
ncbi:uncharacterized protein C16C10.8 [Anabrus simplex]|uniref:uncharacterized protein C16C10.8 n=1 Tax=Anabrus simplex TaxID=316456 RepID=UPI0035A2D321